MAIRHLSLLSAVGMALALIVSAPTEAVAKAYVVGSCASSATPPIVSAITFTTISAAVAAAPANATIYVCPGTYAEQVTIRQPLTLLGVTSGNGSGPVIVPPAHGLVATSHQPLSAISSALPVAPQITVVSPEPVTIENVTLDGGGASTAQLAEVGILFLSTSGVIARSVARNQGLETNPDSLGSGTRGVGFWIENDSGTPQRVVVADNVIQNVNDGIEGYVFYAAGSNKDLTLDVRRNVVTTVSHGINLWQAGGVVTHNIINSIYAGWVMGANPGSLNLGGQGWGIGVMQKSNPVVSENTIAIESPANDGIGLLNAGAALITENWITGASKNTLVPSQPSGGVGIEDIGNSGSATLRSNTITDVVVGINLGCDQPGLTLSSNAINEATAGMSNAMPGTHYTGTFSNVTSIELPCNQ